MPETDTMLDVNYISIFKNLKDLAPSKKERNCTFFPCLLKTQYWY